MCLDEKKTFGTKLIQLIDCGGQLQYHSILPLFIQNPDVIFFVFKVSEELSHYPSVEYFSTDGKQIGNSYKSTLSHEQILKHCLSAICSQNPVPCIITVGTHRDAEVCIESRKKKNQRLQELLDPAHFRFLFHGENLKEPIFPVNAKNPQAEDKDIAHELRKHIVSISHFTVKIPFSWFMLEILIQRSSKDGVISLQNCQECARRLHIEGDKFIACLNHLVKQSILLYYTLLPDVVFCNPQVILNKITELIVYQHKLKYNPDGRLAVGSDMTKFRDSGQFTLKLLEEFPKHYVSGLFTPQNLLNLLISKGAVSAFSEGEYFMPVLLPHLDASNIPKTYNSTSMMFRPILGCIPSGLFSCLVAQLLSKSNDSHWTICMERRIPKCLYNNCVMFNLHQAAETVTLLDMFLYIEVRINTSSYGDCKGIKELVAMGISNACTALNYDHIHFDEAVLCKGAECTADPPHLALVTSYSNKSNER